MILDKIDILLEIVFTNILAKHTHTRSWSEILL